MRALIPPFPEGSEADSLQEWRIRIDLIDRLVLALLNERAVCANRIGRLKKQQGMPVYVPSREDEVLRNVMESNRGPLPDASVKHLFERIIDEIRALERRYVQGEQGEG
ncbi:MAG: chorismate mutase [Rhodothermales bacterium]|nr:chorismate mutase [Rhodothermales bacterium]